MNTGIVYTAMGQKYIDETIRSVNSLRNHMPHIDVTLISNKYVDDDNIDTVIVKENPRNDYGDSIPCFDEIPYDRTVQLDSDTYVCGSFSELFNVLDNFDFGASINPGVTHFENTSDQYLQEVPRGFPVFNSGVMVYKKNKRVESLFKQWKETYLETINNNDKKFNQPALWWALYNSDVRLFPLPREYNCFILFQGVLTGKVKILHGRHPRQEEIATKINKSQVSRSYDKSKYPIEITLGTFPGDEGLGYRTRTYLDENGFASLAGYLSRKLVNHIRR